MLFDLKGFYNRQKNKMTLDQITRTIFELKGIINLLEEHIANKQLDSRVAERKVG